jgi:hypothetical protein
MSSEFEHNLEKSAEIDVMVGLNLQSEHSLLIN